MKKYKRQGNEPSCGPVAIYNTLIWADAPKKTLKYLKKMCNYSGHGTGCIDFHWAADNVAGIKIEDLVVFPNLSDIDNAINNGKAVILRYYADEDHSGHYTLCIGKSKKYYTLVNNRAYNEPGGVTSRVSRKKVSSWLGNVKTLVAVTSYPAAWIIKRT